MSKEWYPIIDQEKCTGCFECVKFCPHDVLEEGDNVALVAYPEKCVDFCRGCQKGACEFEAISYPGDRKE